MTDSVVHDLAALEDGAGTASAIHGAQVTGLVVGHF